MKQKTAQQICQAVPFREIGGTGLELNPLMGTCDLFCVRDGWRLSIVSIPSIMRFGVLELLAS
jgi:hypothetical protein